MRILGLPIPFTGEKALGSLPYGSNSRYQYPIIHEPFPGAWQQNVAINTDTAASFHADFACKTLIARDIAKLRLKLAEKDKDDIWSETTSPAFSPVLRRPNDYQTRNQFYECWMLSKLSRGNAYILKARDDRNVVTGLHVLDPTRVQPLVSDDGSVFYRLSSDNLIGIGEITVPAREIIHDRMNCLFHPLVGTPPVFASGLASMLGLNAQRASALLFENASTPGGILTLPGEISPEEEQRFKEQWESRFSRINLGRVAVMTGGAKYEKMAMTNVEGQMVESLKWSAEVVCSVYHVPPYKVGVGALPTYNNVQALNVEYYFAGAADRTSRRSRSCSTTRSASAGRSASAPSLTPRTCCAWTASRSLPPFAMRSAPVSCRRTRAAPSSTLSRSRAASPISAAAKLQP